MNHSSNVMHQYCTKNNIYLALVLLLQRVRQKHRIKTAASSKSEKSDGSEWWVNVLLQMMCNQNKNSTVLIDGSRGFSGCAQILLATKIGGATAIQKLLVKWTVGYWGPVGTSTSIYLLSPTSLLSPIKSPNDFNSKVLQVAITFAVNELGK